MSGRRIDEKADQCIGIINHLFRHSDKYRGFVSDRRCDSGGARAKGPHISVLLNMLLDHCDQRWVLDTGNAPQPPVAIPIDLDVDGKHVFEAG
jgi:hypothetical protein